MAPGPCLDNSRYTYITHIIICVINLRVMWPPTDGRRWRPHSRTLPRGRPIFSGYLWITAASPCRWLGSSYRQEWRAYYDCQRFWYRAKCLFVFRLINFLMELASWAFGDSLPEADKMGALSSATSWTHLSIEHFRSLVSFGDLQLLEHRSECGMAAWIKNQPISNNENYCLQSSFWGLRRNE